MKHPFEAILSTDDDSNTDTETPTRRQMIGRAVSAGAVVAGLGGVGGLGGAANAASSNDKPGSEGSSSSSKPPAAKPENPTSTRKGEEGGLVTTQAVGEEGGNLHGGDTTKAVGEEGGFRGPGTTKAVGEEGGCPGPLPKTPKFAAYKPHYEAAMKRNDIYAASSYFNAMKRHPEAKDHKTFLDKAEAAVIKGGSAILAEAKAAAKKGDINTAFEKTRMLEFYFGNVDVVMQANKFHVELRNNEKYKKGYKQAVREFAAKQQFTRAEMDPSVEHKRRIYQGLARDWPDTVYGKKAAEALKKMPAAKPKPVPGRPTTLAVGEEG